MKNLKNIKGITLVALVVTVVILLILAGVSINLILGNQGLIRKANEGRKNYVNASEEERLLLGSLSDALDAYASGKRILEKGELALEYEIVIDDQTNDKYVKITPKMGGLESYPEYARRILDATNKTKEQIFMEGNLHWSEENNDPDTSDLAVAKNSNNFSQFIYIFTHEDASGISNIEAFRVWANENWSYNYKTVDDLLIGEEIVEPAGFDGFYENYARNILNTTSKTDEELFMEGELYKAEVEGWDNLNDMEAATNFTEFVYADLGAEGLTTMEQVRQYFISQEWGNYSTVDQLLIDMHDVEPAGFINPYQDIYVECEETGQGWYITLGYSEYFYIEEDGTYTFTGEAENGATATQIVKVKEEEVEEELEEELDWITILANATTKHPDQTLSNDIGIGTDGNLVNLDLWEYDVINNNEIVLANTNGNSSYATDWSAGYVGGYVNGRIIGSVPQYIKINGNNSFYTVTSMEDTFYFDQSLIYAPEIPITVTSMFATFDGCVNLVSAPIVPESVTNIAWCFGNCLSLTGVIEINCEYFENYSQYSNCFSYAATGVGCDLKLSGSSPYLNEILATKSNDSHISLKDD